MHQLIIDFDIRPQIGDTSCNNLTFVCTSSGKKSPVRLWNVSLPKAISQPGPQPTLCIGDVQPAALRGSRWEDATPELKRGKNLFGEGEGESGSRPHSWPEKQPRRPRVRIRLRCSPSCGLPQSLRKNNLCETFPVERFRTTAFIGGGAATVFIGSSSLLTFLRTPLHSKACSGRRKCLFRGLSGPPHRLRHPQESAFR